ncbi:MAG: response regulator [Acidobacteriia bacterium]|nr:response regulator [Terriglobia bacterium]
MNRAVGVDDASKAHIVVVDDDLLVREGLCDCVESAGYSVEGFASAEEFLASNSEPDTACLILDIQLPGQTGLELQRRLRNAAGPPIVFVTANVMDAIRETALKLGAKGFLSKPVRCQDLLIAVRAAIES